MISRAAFRSFNGVLLFVLVLLAIRGFDGRGATTLFESPVFAALIIALLFGFLALSLWPENGVERRRSVDTARVIILSLLVLLVLVVPLLSGIHLRHVYADVGYTHDHPLQDEIAAKVLLSGRNPYDFDYRTTPLFAWDPKNPALDHLVSLPFEFLIAVPASIVSEALIGWYDHRFLHLLGLLVSLGVILTVSRMREVGLLAFILFAFNPYFTTTFIAGFNDVMSLGLLALFGWALVRRRYLAAGLWLGFALATKHFAFAFGYFAFLFLLVQGNPGFPFGKKFALAARRFLPSILLAGVLILPFFFWNPHAFIDDTVRYPSGGLPTSYPIAGIGFSELLLRAGVFSTNDAPYPFWRIQLPIAIPLLVLLSFWMLKAPSVGRLFLSASFVLLALLFFSRFFNVNYPGFIISASALGFVFWSREQNSHGESS